jgi:dTDP-4-dehydrorhamnose 3,5-epimerase
VIFTPTTVSGVFVIEPERLSDERGYFARTYCADEFRSHGLDPCTAQCSTSFNATAGTLRGLHYFREPPAEAKLVRCTRGAIFDVAVDLRPTSRTYCQWVGVELSADNGHALYIPEGCAHGFLTLLDGAEVFYQNSRPYRPGAEVGVRWDDPVFGIRWPFRPIVMADRDASFPDFQPIRLADQTM